MLYTLTTNPAVDVNLTADKIAVGAVNRTRDLVFSPNGKGLNVSFALRHFGVSSGIMGFFGGFTGEYITEYCENNGYPLAAVGIEGITRVNFFVNSREGEYKFVNNGPLVSAEKQNELLDIISNRSDIDVLAINGSSANGQTEDFYDRVFEICCSKNIPIILDISSPKLKSLLKYRPLLIKPNNEEVEEIFGFNTGNEAEMISTLQALHGMGAQNVLVTLGDKGAYFSDGKEIYHCNTKEVVMKSSACAGDAFLAGFLSIWLDNKNNVEQALKRAAAAGANTAESDGLGDFLKVSEYEKNICVRRIEIGGQE